MRETHSSDLCPFRALQGTTHPARLPVRSSLLTRRHPCPYDPIDHYYRYYHHFYYHYLSTAGIAALSATVLLCRSVFILPLAHALLLLFLPLYDTDQRYITLTAALLKTTFAALSQSHCRDLDTACLFPKKAGDCFEQQANKPHSRPTVQHFCYLGLSAAGKSAQAYIQRSRTKQRDVKLFKTTIETLSQDEVWLP